MKIFKDSDDCVYTLDQIRQFNKENTLLNKYEFMDLKALKVGGKIYPGCGQWIERIK